MIDNIHPSLSSVMFWGNSACVIASSSIDGGASSHLLTDRDIRNRRCDDFPVEFLNSLVQSTVLEARRIHEEFGGWEPTNDRDGF